MLGNKIVAFDRLRIVAIFSVIILHASVDLFLYLYPSFDWDMANLYESFSRWNVSVFFMISGALFLRNSKKLDIKKLYSKNILHIVVVFLFWSLVYGILYGKIGFNYNEIFEIVRGPHHFWFLKALLGLYIAISLFKYIVSKEKFEISFLIITFFLGILIPSSISIVGVFDKQLESVFIGFYDKFKLELIFTYSFYFVIGHYLLEYPPKNIQKYILYFLGVISPFVVMILTRYVTKCNELPVVQFFENSFICTAIEAMAIFVLFITKFNSMCRFDDFIAKVSKNVMGIYIVHVMVMSLLSEFGIESNLFNSLFFIPIYSIVVFAFSYVFVELLQKIPFVNKWLI